MQDTKKEYYAYLDLLRLIGACLIVALHSFPMYSHEMSLGNNLISAGIYQIALAGVGLFIAISGALFLGSEKERTFSEMGNKYIPRLLWCILLFGTLFSLMTQVATSGGFAPQMLGRALLDVLSGTSWEHMWYLYMLVGLYLITPIVQPFVRRASAHTMRTALLILFVFNSVVPIFEIIMKRCMVGDPPVVMGFDIPIYKIDLFYYFLGSYFVMHAKKPKKIAPHIAAAAASVLLALLAAYWDFFMPYGFEIIHNYSSVLSVWLTYELFVIIKYYGEAMDEKIARHMFRPAKMTFGVYLIHPVFLHIGKIMLPRLGISLSPMAQGGVLFVFALVGAFTGTYILRKIPIVREKLL